MALQLGALRNALESAGCPADKADAASEEIVVYLRSRGISPGLPAWIMLPILGAFCCGVFLGAALW